MTEEERRGEREVWNVFERNRSFTMLSRRRKEEGRKLGAEAIHGG